jgi:short-subunit dehydrogenase
MNTATTQNQHRPDSKGIAIVTGASSGLGAVYADRLARRGFDLILVARRAERLQKTAEQLGAAYGVDVNILAVDLADRQGLERLATEITTNPRITMLVNNAGIATLAPIADMSEAQIEAMLELNVRALARLSQLALQKFLARDAGTIINIGSVLSFHTLPVSGVYSATKGYVMNFTRGLQTATEGTGVRVQLVLPASTATEIWDLSGIPLANLTQSSVMAVEHCVDAALAGLDQGELVTLPSVEDKQLWEAYDTARAALFAATQTGKPASRYGVA